MHSIADPYCYSRHIISVLLVSAVLLVATYAGLSAWLQKPLPIQQAQTIAFERGSNITAFSHSLHDSGFLEYPVVLQFWTRVQNIDTKLKAGEYEITPGDTLAILLEKMLRGEVKQYSITLVEGWNFKQMMQAINTHPQLKRNLSYSDPSDVMQQLGLTTDNTPLHPEGQFLPDTYYIDNSTTDVELLIRAHQALQQSLTQAWESRQKDLPLKNQYEALILASIIEKESAVADERPTISGVFINRLRKRMKLQTDPTVIYGMGDAYDGDIRYRDLRKDTPYNTYTRRGLPPTPIAMPGAAAIHAAVQPAQTEYLYFVASSDGSGRHLFSRTLAEHEKWVDIHQRGK